MRRRRTRSAWLTGTVHLVASASFIVSPIPHRTVPRLSDAGSDPFAISCPSTHPIVTSLHGRTTSVHLSLRSALQGDDLASLKQGAVLKKGVWIAYPLSVH